jgi:hypothetical protein
VEEGAVGILDVAGAERTAFIESLEAMLRPLMPLMLNYGVTYADAQDVIRALYVESMSGRISDNGRPATPARLALITGLNVGEVVKLAAQRDERAAEQQRRLNKVDQITRILSIWHDDPQFSTPYGAPLDLSIKPEGGFRTVDELREVACPELDKATLVDELVAAGCVELHAGKFIRCRGRTFVPSSIDVSRITRLGRQAGALNTTIAHNLLRDPEIEPFFERGSVSNSLVSQEYRDEALVFLRREGQLFLDKFDKWGAEREPELQDPTGRRYGVSVFFHEETQMPSDLDFLAVGARLKNETAQASS